MTEKSERTISIVFRAALTATVVVSGAYILYANEFFVAFAQIDNLVGLMPVALVMMFVAASIAVMWMDHKMRLAALSVALCFTAVVSVALVPNALRGDWWIFAKPDTTGKDAADISAYAPFTEGSQAVKLDEPSELVLDKDLPVLDGALALYPVYAALAQTVFAKEAYERDPNSVMFTNTLRAYDGIIAGERNIVFVAGASQSQMQKAQSSGVELVFTPIGKEAFVFLVGKTNPTENITTQQIRNVYSGKTARWSTLGWREGGKIIAFQRPEGSGSQTGLQQIMKNLPIVAPQPIPAELIGENSLMKQISVEYKGVQPALGYSYKFFAETMLKNPDCKILSVDGVAPTKENIRSGAYPFTVEFYAVTNGAPEGNAARVIDYLLSPQGQKLIELTGYTSIV